MSNGIGRVWAVNAEGGDEGRPNGVGPVWIENADQLGSKLPEPESGDAGKVLGVLNADGDIGWVVDQSGTLTQVQSDWAQTDSSQVSYIANKPNLATVATTGAYSDLSGTPTIPTVNQVYDASSANAQSGVAVASAVSGKQDTINDLETIRSGAAAGATAVQPAALNDYATTSALTSGLSMKQDTISDLETIRSGAAAGATAVQPGDLATVATTGSYDDLLDKPTIPTATSDLQNDSGFITLSDVPAQAQANWSETNPSSPSYIQNKPTIPPGTVVDQTYDATSANAQSGVAVAGALATVKQVPSSTSSDEDKVLTVDSNGDPVWAAAQGGSSYTAGDGIAITNDEIKVRVKDDGSNPLKFTTQQEGGTYASIVTPEGTPSSEGWKAIEPDTYYLNIEYDEDHNKTYISFRYLWNRNDPNPLGMVSMSEDSNKHFDAKLHLLTISRKESYTDLIATSDTVSDAFTAGWDASHSLYTYSLGSLVETTDDGDVFSVEFDVSGDQTGAFNAIAFSSSGSDYSGILETVQSSFLSESHVLALQGDGVYIVGDTIPGGELYVEVDQTFNSGSSKPQSGYAVNDAINSVRQVPAGSWDDTGKALVYDDAEGYSVWADQSSASIGRDGTSLTVRLRNANGSNNSGLAVNTTETPTSITGVVASGGPNSSYYATFTKAVALDPDADTINITGFEASIPSGTGSPVYAIVVDGSTWQSGTLTGGIICDRDTDDYPYGIDLANPAPRKAYVITDPTDQWATSTFFSDVNTFMVFGVSEDNLVYDHGTFQGNFVNEWMNSGLYSALEQYAVAMTQPSGDVEFEIPTRPVETRGLYVSNPVPSIAGNAGKILAVNSSATGTEWVASNSYTFSTGLTTSGNTVSVTNPVPAISGHAGQILAVNSGATGTEWVNAPSASVSATGVIAGNGTSPSPLQLNYNSTLTSVNGVIPEIHTQSLSWDNSNHLSGIAVTYADYNKLKNLGYSNVKLQLVFPSTYVCALTRQGSNDDCYLHIADTTGNYKGVSGGLGNVGTGYTVVPDLSNITLSSLGFTTENALYDGTYYIWFSTNYQAVSYQDEVGTMYNVFADYNPSLGDGTDTTTVVNIGATGAQLGVSVASLTTAGITDIQQVASLPANPVATVLYLIPEA